MGPEEGTGVELERLIETERRLDDLLRQARDQAAAIVQEARDAVARREAAVDAELAAAAGKAEATLAAERQRVAAEIAAAARDQIARYDGVDEPRMQAAARLLVERLLTDGGGT
jgi:vacuolar-type H+-ATPase subunit H